MGAQSGAADDRGGEGPDIADIDSFDIPRALEDCPCRALAGKTPLLGTVVAWDEGRLTLHVEQVLLQDPPPNAPSAGAEVVGVFVGKLPCWTTVDYLARPGDRVVAFLTATTESGQWPCCNDCRARCTGLDPADASACLSECQSAAAAQCKERWANESVAGTFEVAPVQSGALTLARWREEHFALPLDSLDMIFAGGQACEDGVGNARRWQTDLNKKLEMQNLDAEDDYDPEFGVIPPVPGLNRGAICPDSRP